VGGKAYGFSLDGLIAVLVKLKVIAGLRLKNKGK